MTEKKTKIMDPKIKNQWINALLGKGKKKYQQGKGKLKTKDGKYCCLGVLADVCGVLGCSNQHDDERRVPSKSALLSDRNRTFLVEMGLDKQGTDPNTKYANDIENIL